MDLFTPVNPQSLFMNYQTQAQLEGLSQRALTRGIDYYQNKDYEKAATEFQRSLGIAPQSSYAIQASTFLANTYLRLNKPEKAIDTYKTVIQANPNRADLRSKLGNIYLNEEKYTEAEAEYKTAYRLDPSVNNEYALGQLYLETDRLSMAEQHFTNVMRKSPYEGSGNYGLGLVDAKQGNYKEAISQFEEAIRLKDDFIYAHADIGYAYVDMGDMDKAKEKLEFLQENDPGLAAALEIYMNETSKPSLNFAYSADFGWTQGRGTKVKNLHTDLIEPNTSHTFTMSLYFDKKMDLDSIQNLTNWEISRANGSGPGEAYNFGISTPSTEATISRLPNTVSYDPIKKQANITFTIHQNDNADATIDPGHIQFRFKGEDAYGNSMDPAGDEFSGYSRIA